MADHPGGDDLILSWAGKDVKAIMADESEHEHSDAAYSIMADFQIGVLGARETTCAADNEIDENFMPTDTRIEDDFERNQFLDLSQPLFMQVFRSNFSKSFYLQQVHQPRHLPESPRLFGPAVLEGLTRTVWWVVPAIWLPASAWLMYRSLSHPAGTAGVAIASFRASASASPRSSPSVRQPVLDVHRIRHAPLPLPPGRPPAGPSVRVDAALPPARHPPLRPDGPPSPRHATHPLLRPQLPVHAARARHLPDPRRQRRHLGLVRVLRACARSRLVADSQVLYDCGHYALHHTKLPQYLATMKAYHMAHHFKNPDAGASVRSAAVLTAQASV